MSTLNPRQILLVHPLGYGSEASGKDISRLSSIVPPLGLASLAAYLSKKGIEATIVDCYARPDSNRLIRDILLKDKPAFMGLSCTTSSFLDGVRITGLAKSILSNIQVVVGGAHVSALKERILEEFSMIDFAAIGEGEETLAELIECGGKEAAEVKGVVYRDTGGEVCFTGYREKGADLDTLPFPSYEKLEGYPHVYKLPLFNYPVVPNSSCITSRGCPYSCSYCDRSVFRRSFRYNSAEYMYEHVHYLKERFGVRHVLFYDDQFSFHRKRVLDFTRMLIDRPLGLTFSCVARAEHLDLDLLKQMKEAGCWMISLGIETGDENLLAQHRKHTSLGLLADKIHLIHKVGIRTKGLLMMGLPGETETSIRKSMDYVLSLPLDQINVAKFTPFPGSPIYERIHELGEFDENWEKMDCMHFLFIPLGLTLERMEELFKEFYKNYFIRPSILWSYTTMLWRSPDSWSRFVRNAPYFFKFAKSNKRFGGI